MAEEIPFQSLRELQEAESLLSSDGWFVHQDYRIEKGIIQPLTLHERKRPAPVRVFARHGTSTYAPMGRPELPAELAKVADEREATLLAFVRRYGLLGQHQALLAEPPIPPSIETLTQSERGDSVAWVLAHARTARLVMELAHSLADDDQAAATLDKAKDSHGNLNFAVARGAFRASTTRISAGDAAGDARSIIRVIISDIMDANLRSVRLCLRPFRIPAGHRKVVEEFRLEFEAPSLVANVYRLLADALVAGRIRECAFDRCRRLFVATDDRMKYCPPSLGGGTVSPCMNRAKVAEHRKHRRAKVQGGTR